jgi:hypothetical protein
MESDQPMRLANRKEAVRLRKLVADATTDVGRKLLEDQARARDPFSAVRALMRHSLPRMGRGAGGR